MCDMSSCGAESQIGDLQQDIWQLQAEVRNLEGKAQRAEDAQRSAPVPMAAYEAEHLKRKVNEIATILGVGGV